MPNLRIFAATVGIPLEVAMMFYDSSYSASRGAMKDWEHTIEVERAKLTENFYGHIYTLWLHLEIMSGNIAAPGYVNAFVQGNNMALLAYRGCSFEGDRVPHIDPLKEVNAVRTMLGDDDAPLITREAARATLGIKGSHSAMAIKAAKEREDLGELFTTKSPDPVEPDDEDDE